MDYLRDNMKIKLLTCTHEEVQFEICGIDAALANTFRRILLAETPTMAFENIYIKNNTSIMQDEVLAHRLGLLPIKVDPDLFEDFDGENNENNTLVFKLKVKCTKNDMESVDLSIPRESPTVYKTVYSGAIKWDPRGSQKKRFERNPC